MEKKIKENNIKKNITIYLAKNLKKYRKAAGLSQKEIADKLGVHLTHISRVETGKYPPSLEFIVRASKILGISVDSLLSESEDYTKEVRIEDKDLMDRLRLLETLNKNERDALITVIDSMLTKHRMRSLIDGEPLK